LIIIIVMCRKATPQGMMIAGVDALGNVLIFVPGGQLAGGVLIVSGMVAEHYHNKAKEEKAKEKPAEKPKEPEKPKPKKEEDPLVG
jgi:dihydroxyacid dehydratase/phosphogluconate dehydratase